MLCVPAAKLLVLHVAFFVFTAPAGKATAPQPLIVVPPSVKLTLPVGAIPLTVVVNVTLVPADEGFELLDSIVVLVVTPEFTTSDRAALLEAVLPASPL
jgi:hypothetical protein